MGLQAQITDHWDKGSHNHVLYRTRTEPFCHSVYDTCAGCEAKLWTPTTQKTYRLHSAHEMSPRARLRRSSGPDMALRDATRVRVVGVEVDAAMGDEEELFKWNHARDLGCICIMDEAHAWTD